MLRDLILKYRTQRNIKEHKRSRQARYDQADRIGIFFNMAEFSYEQIKELANIFRNDGKEVNILGYTPKLDGPVKFDVVVRREVRPSGAIKSAEFDTFLQNSFDFLVSMSYDTDSTFRYLLSSCQSLVNVGIESDEDLASLVDLQIKGQRGTETRDIAHYLKMIK